MPKSSREIQMENTIVVEMILFSIFEIIFEIITLYLIWRKKR